MIHRNENHSIAWKATIHYFIALFIPFWDSEPYMYPEGRALTDYERRTKPYIRG